MMGPPSGCGPTPCSGPGSVACVATMMGTPGMRLLIRLVRLLIKVFFLKPGANKANQFPTKLNSVLVIA